MKNIGYEIDKILTERKIKKQNFATRIGMSNVNLSKILKKETINADLLEKFAIALNIPITYFFEENNDNQSNKNFLNNSISADNGGVVSEAAVNYKTKNDLEKENNQDEIRRLNEQIKLLSEMKDYLRTHNETLLKENQILKEEIRELKKK